MKTRLLARTLLHRRLFIVLAVAFGACLVAFWKDVDQPTYRGRTVEQWLSSSDWVDRQAYVELVLLTEFGDQSVPILNEILLRKGARQELAVLQHVPIARKLCRSRLTRGQLKDRVIASIGFGSLSVIGSQFLPTLLVLAQRCSPKRPHCSRRENCGCSAIMLRRCSRQIWSQLFF